MKGYKLTQPDGVFLKNPKLNKPLEVGNLYKENVRIRIHGPGYHFCRYVWDTLLYGILAGSEIYEIDTEENEFVGSRDKLSYVTTGFVVTRKLEYTEVHARIESLDPDIIIAEPPQLKKRAIQQGYWIQTLLSDSNTDIRRQIAENGYFPYILAFDREAEVRAAVARSGNCMDKLLHDVDWRVRYEVAKNGYGLEELQDDPNSDVREAAKLRTMKPADFATLQKQIHRTFSKVSKFV